MATAVLPSVSVSGPLPLSSRATSSRAPPPLTSPNMSEPPRPMSRLRSTLEQSLSKATRSKKSTEQVNTKGKDKATAPDDKPGMLRRLESKVNFRRSVTPAAKDIPKDKSRVAAVTGFITPSLRQASISSPALHMSSIPAQSVFPSSSSSNTPALVSPPCDRTRPKDISRPLSPKEAKDARLKSTSKHKTSQSQPINIPSSPSTPTRSDVPTPPDTPTPPSGSRSQPLRLSSKNRSSSQHTPPSSPSQLTPRNASPIRPRSPSSRNRVGTPIRGLSSSSTSHLPTTPIQSSPPRRPSIDSPRKPSIEARRPSGALSPRDESPSPVRPRPRSPSQRSYAQNRHFNISTSSLTFPPNPEQRELIRTATSMLCKEIIKPPPHMARTESGLRDWEEVEAKTQALARLERIWHKSGFSASSNNVNASHSSAPGEERERRLFCEALRDGFVLCQ